MRGICQPLRSKNSDSKQRRQLQQILDHIVTPRIRFFTLPVEARRDARVTPALHVGRQTVAHHQRAAPVFLADERKHLVIKRLFRLLAAKLLRDEDAVEIWCEAGLLDSPLLRSDPNRDPNAEKSGGFIRAGKDTAVKFSERKGAEIP